MSTSHLAAFIAGSSLVAIVAISILARLSGFRVDAAREDSYRIVRGLQAMVMGALLVVFVAGAFAGAR